MRWFTFWCSVGAGLGLLALTPPAESSCFVRSRAVFVHKPAVVVKKVVEAVPVAVFAPVPVYGAVYAAPAVVPAAPPPAAAAPAGAGDALGTIMFELRRLNSRIDQMERHMGLQPPKGAAPGAAPRMNPANGSGDKLPAPKEREGPPEGAAAGPRLKDEPHPALAVLKNKCASCHAANVSATKGGDFTLFEGAALAGLTERQLRKVGTMTYTGRMPPKDSGHTLSDEEVSQIMDFLDKR